MYKEFKKPKRSDNCDKSSICNKRGSEDEKIFKRQESAEIFKNSWFN